MKENEFDDWVGRLRRFSPPPCPGSMEQNVLRRIRLSQSEAESALAWLLGWVPRPSVALSTLAVVTVSSLVTAAVTVQAERDELPARARVALGFDAFEAPQHLPLNDR